MDLPRLLDARDLRDRLVASDPALERLRTGLRAVTGAAVSAALLSRAGSAAGVPPTVWLLGVSFAMSSAVFVPESGASRERRALGLVTAAAVASAGLAAIRSSWCCGWRRRSSAPRSGWWSRRSCSRSGRGRACGR